MDALYVLYNDVINSLSNFLYTYILIILLVAGGSISPSAPVLSSSDTSWSPSGWSCSPAPTRPMSPLSRR